MCSNNNKNNTMGTLINPSLSTNDIKHPLANNPITSEQNIDYKDYLTSSSESYLSPQDGVNIGIDIIAGILKFLGIPFTGAIAEYYKWVVSKLWPSSNSNEIWETFMKKMESLIDRKIAEHIKKDAISKLKGLQEGLESYMNALESWQRNTRDFQTKLLVKDRFVALDMIFKTTIPQFAVKDGEVLLLPIYAQAANLHLYLIKDAQIFGEDWGMKQKEINLFHEEQLKATGKYINHCLEWYTRELSRLSEDKTAKGWLTYHRFRREMTLILLDLISVFPYYDIRTYPIPTAVQLTRDLYSSPNGYNPAEGSSWSRPWSNVVTTSLFDRLEKDFIRPPHLFELLKSIEIATIKQKLPLNDKEYINHWSGHSLTCTNINGSTTNKYDYGFINSSDKDKMDLHDNDAVWTFFDAACLSNAYGSIYGIPIGNFYTGKGNGFLSNYVYLKGHTTSSNSIERYNSFDEIPRENGGVFSHRLSHITFSSFSPANGIYFRFPVFTWTHMSANLNNAISSDKITQIPLVKAYTKDSGTTVIRGNGFTGGDLLSRKTPGVVAQLEVNVNSSLSQRYKVRVRYCSTTNMRIYIKVSGQRIYATTVNKTRVKNQPVKYESYNLGTIETSFTFSKKVDNVTVGVDTFKSNEEVYIDKVEFIPVK
ncbi:MULTISPECIES: insecticidal delta-endotoxin Cry8Ea1 family protein [Bacillus cereus group]|uniref:insecticidal delta-endotoxin Cry8Ea1 family protein n=1 Tax=Bacillus cereus group TaxID=86661 RepID=UPI0007B6F513|nr:insecticidal delta-endotoxin Cry8Ea1 family protein [Bacillus cereus]ANC11094.1 hypothetical protein WR47_28715 [Bacillus cereus]ANC17142.1 hypothetical protein WR51_29955 [Bacillus cereus]MDA1995926.1 insecticidal delta-endotoxin Cry8Ea1 family protein [Bacillus cereus]MDA2001859.1 insecticidal delta-endotoxin Cry8Ea1 family protein [Bacillus cereus]MDA3654529.1 insecticidal delta-endotoxin Cry8Ea1 family protein [Bacillus cereus]